MTEGEKEFIRGYACATAFVASISCGLGMPDAARDMIGEGGFSRKDLEAAGVENVDIKTIYGELDFE